MGWEGNIYARLLQEWRLRRDGREAQEASEEGKALAVEHERFTPCLFLAALSARHVGSWFPNRGSNLCPCRASVGS